MDYYGLQCYNKNSEAMGWLYSYNNDRDVSYISNTCNSKYSIKSIKRWKTRNGAMRGLAKYNPIWCKWGKGFLSVERLPDRFYEHFS